MSLPACNHCKTIPTVISFASETGRTYFVICRSDECSLRADGLRGEAGRPLSNGMDSQYKAERDWIDESRKMAELGV